MNKSIFNSMRKTRNLFLLTGTPSDLIDVLGTLNFKGLIAHDYGVPVMLEQIQVAFDCNKSFVCAADDYPGEYPPYAIFINLMRSNVPHTYKAGAKFINMERTAILQKTDPEEYITNQFEAIVNSLNCDVGDHKSNSSGLNGTPTVADCVYCKYLAGIRGHNEATVYRSKNFFVIPGSGQYAKGYLLVMPIAHIMSNAELSPEHLKEFKEVVEDIETILKITYGKEVLIWENGSGNGGVGKAKDSIVHSHVHFLPSTLTSDDVADVSGFQFTEITLEDLHLYTQNSYLLMRTPDKEHWVINDNPKLYIPRQYLRQITAKEYGIPNDLWNWRKYPFVENMHQTVMDIKTALEEHKEELSDRLKNNTRCLFE